jgi:hypothetical protein
MVKSATLFLTPGVYTYEFDGNNYSSGIYSYQINTASGFIQTKKMLLQK